MSDSTDKPKPQVTSRASKSRKPVAESPATTVGRRPLESGDWREDTLASVRAMILAADPEMVEERKWRKPSNGMAGVPV